MQGCCARAEQETGSLVVSQEARGPGVAGRVEDEEGSRGTGRLEEETTEAKKP